MMIDENSKDDLDTLVDHDLGSAMVGLVLVADLTIMVVPRLVCTVVDLSPQPYSLSSPLFRWHLP